MMVAMKHVAMALTLCSITSAGFATQQEDADEAKAQMNVERTKSGEKETDAATTKTEALSVKDDAIEAAGDCADPTSLARGDAHMSSASNYMLQAFIANGQGNGEWFDGEDDLMDGDDNYDATLYVSAEGDYDDAKAHYVASYPNYVTAYIAYSNALVEYEHALEDYQAGAP